MSNDFNLLISDTTFNQAFEGFITKQLSVHTREAYLADAQQFLSWLTYQQLQFANLSQSDIWQYRRYLSDHFAKSSAARKLVVARKLLDEAVTRGLIAYNPARIVPGYKGSTEQETTHTALTIDQAQQLLTAIDTTTSQGKRDFAILLLLLRTGLRRSECAALKLEDMVEEQGHFVVIIRHAKGDKRRKVKVPVDVKRAIEDYLNTLQRPDFDLAKEANSPLFVQFRKGDHPQSKAISGQVIERIVHNYTEKSGLSVKLTPHGLRATFVTVALEGGAKLQQVQYAVGHTDPTTTERYQKRKLNLDNHAVDYVHITVNSSNSQEL